MPLIDPRHPLGYPTTGNVIPPEAPMLGQYAGQLAPLRAAPLVNTEAQAIAEIVNSLNRLAPNDTDAETRVMRAVVALMGLKL